MLKKLKVQNYKCFENFECEFGPTQLLIGGNGSGKSTVFEVLETLRDVVGRGEPLNSLQGRGSDSDEWRIGGRTATRWSEKPEIQRLEIEVELAEGAYAYLLAVEEHARTPRPFVRTERLSLSNRVVFEYTHRESEFFTAGELAKRVYGIDFRPDFSVLEAQLREGVDGAAPFAEWLRRLQVFRPDPLRMSGVAGREARFPRPDLSNFAEWYRHLRQDSDDSAYRAELRDIIEGFGNLRLEEAGERRRELKFSFSRGGNGASAEQDREYLMSELSLGQRVLVGLYAVLHFAMKPGATVCLDEPDNFISLKEVMPWLQRTLEVAEGNDPPSQVLIASHHPELLNWMAFKEGILFERPDGGPARVRRFGDTLKTGLSASELVARGWDDV